MGRMGRSKPKNCDTCHFSVQLKQMKSVILLAATDEEEDEEDDGNEEDD